MLELQRNMNLKLVKNMFKKRGIVIKENKKRTIYKYLDFYIKHDHPQELKHKLKSYFFPKSKKEYNSAIVLKKEGIPIVPVLGWKKDGCNSFLITKEILGAVLLKDFLQDSSIISTDIDIFLTCLCRFLKMLVEKGVDHPDLHSGNILVRKEGNKYSFYLLDLYGIKIRKKLNKSQIFRIFGWLVSLLWSLEEDMLEDFLIESGFCRRGEDLYKKWNELVRWRLNYIKSICKKRKWKLFKESSICREFETKNGRILLKDYGDLKKKKGYLVKIFSKEDAVRCWMNSYYLRLFGIPVFSHFLMMEDRDRIIIFMEMPDGKRPAKKKDLIERFYSWCKNADIIPPSGIENIYLKENPFFPLYFSNPEEFLIRDVED